LNVLQLLWVIAGPAPGTALFLLQGIVLTIIARTKGYNNRHHAGAKMNPVELTLFASRLNAVCDEMGGVLRRAAFSPNIRDRLDFSCAIFDAAGDLCAQAAHIPVHLGSMAYAMRSIVNRVSWMPGDTLVFNDPYLGGTHLPDVTLVSPVFVDDRLRAFVANRAHHADIGAESPGSMPISSSLEQEGLVLEPAFLIRNGEWNSILRDKIVSSARRPDESLGDFSAQVSSNLAGGKRLQALITKVQACSFQQAVDRLNDYGETLARQMIADIPDGEYSFADVLDDDGMGGSGIPLNVTLTVDGERCHLDFSGTSAQVQGNVNCPLSVTAAGVLYVFRCLMPPQTPSCAGIFRPITLSAPEGSLLNARFPAAVAAGNVETSTRVVDLVCGALAQAIPDCIPAASHGSMNNLAMGASGERAWDYYETIGGGMGSGRHGGGLSAVQTHMTNTRNTPVEVLESHFPMRVEKYAIRRGSGGEGKRPGGNGIVRAIRFLEDARFTLLTERRRSAPWGLESGGDGKPGRNLLNGQGIPAKCERRVSPGDLLTVETPGGGGWGSPGE
jgi:N-methylhydantoinase B